NRLIEARRDAGASERECAYSEGFLIGWVLADVLLVGSVEHLVVINAVAHANGGRAFAKRIPRQAKAGTEITLRSFDHVLPIRRGCRSAIVGSSLIVLRVHNQAVAEITSACNSITGAGHQGSVCSNQLRRIEIRESSVYVPRRAEIRISQAVIDC